MKEHRIFSALYEHVYTRLEPSDLRRCRARIAGKAAGKVLEIGIGNGLNLPFYRTAKEVWGVDPDPSMLEKGRARAGEAMVPVELVQGEAEELPFADDSFDTVVVTLVFCSVRDPERAAREMFRVLKKGGELRFLEHVVSEKESWAAVQSVLSPAWSRIAAGCRLDRDSLGYFRKAGFVIKELDFLMGGIFPVIAGTGLKKGGLMRQNA